MRHLLPLGGSDKKFLNEAAHRPLRLTTERRRRDVRNTPPPLSAGKPSAPSARERQKIGGSDLQRPVGTSDTAVDRGNGSAARTTPPPRTWNATVFLSEARHVEPKRVHRIRHRPGGTVLMQGEGDSTLLHQAPQKTEHPIVLRFAHVLSRLVLRQSRLRRLTRRRTLRLIHEERFLFRFRTFFVHSNTTAVVPP